VVNVAIAMPYREADDRRLELANFTWHWLRKNHPDSPVSLGDSPAGPFNRGHAINDAARKAGDWDVLVVHDADNICHPEAFKAAVTMAHASGKVFYPFETYVYLDENSSNGLMHYDSWFVAPEIHPQHGYRTTVRRKHYSGIQVIPRGAYEAAGGFIELTGWGAEDAIMDTVFDVFASGSEWMGGAAYHLWHPANRNDPKDADNVRNHSIWQKVHAITQRGQTAQAMRDQWVPKTLRAYLATQGYVIP